MQRLFDLSLHVAMQGWLSLTSPSDKNGVLIIFAAPSLSPVIRTAQYAPLDVLMIDKEGTIKQIAPNIILSEFAAHTNITFY